MKTHVVEIKTEKDGILKKIKGEMSFSNGIEQTFEYTQLPPSSTVVVVDEFAHLLKHVDMFNKRIDGSIVSLEISSR